MDHFDIAKRTTDRRNFLTAGAVGAVGAAAVLAGGALADPANAATPQARSAHRGGWPHRPLPPGAAHNVDSSEFLSLRQFREWGAEANRIGLRATGSTRHERYVRLLAQRLHKAGVRDVRLDPVPMKRWLAKDWSLTVNGKKLANTFYMPYTQQTGRAGLNAQMVYLSGDATAVVTALSTTNVKGKIIVFDVPYTSLLVGTFEAIAFPGGVEVPAGDPRGPGTPYKRPYLNSVGPILDAVIASGAAGAVGIWPDLPGDWAKQYTPYDGVFRPFSGLWIDRDAGAQLRPLAAAGAKATLRLEATVEHTITHNVIGFIPGKSTDLTVLHSHTDGTNAIEENGPLAIIGTAQYLARLPRASLERTVMVFLSTGHFLGGVGIKNFLKSRSTTLVPRISSILTLEHLGTLEWLPQADGKIRPTGLPELAAYFTPDDRGTVNASIAAQQRTGIQCNVDRPFSPVQPDQSPLRLPVKQPVGWPGEGTYFWWFGSLLDTNFITGPYGLITADLDTIGMVDYDLLRKQAMVAVKTTLQLASTSTSDFGTPVV